MWELVRQIAAARTTVLLTTQYLEEADQLAEQIAVIDQGRIVAEGTSAQLKARVGSGSLHVWVLDGRQQSEAQAVLSSALAAAVDLEPDYLTLSVRLSNQVDPVDVGALVGRAISELSDARVAVAEMSVGQPSLDVAFLALTGRPSASGLSTDTGDRS